MGIQSFTAQHTDPSSPGQSTGWSWWDRLAERQHLVIVLSGLLALTIRLLLFPILGYPVLKYFDEFAITLGAQTFALGRLTNPTPLFWEHFETYHTLMQPTYNSVYPPGQSLLMAASLVVFGHPWWGLLLMMVFLCSVTTWMLYQWLPPRWALLGGLLLPLHFGFLHYWVNTYFIASIPALGGSLVLGVIPGLTKAPKVRHGLLAGLGFVFLALSRPYEGLLMSVGAAAGTLLHGRPPGAPQWRSLLIRFALPAVVVVLPALLWLGHYQRALTGSPTTFPYALYRGQMQGLPVFAWQTPNWDREYRHEAIRAFFQEFEPGINDARQWGTWAGLLPNIKGRIQQVGATYFPEAAYLPIALVSLIAATFSSVRPLGVAIAAVLAGNALVNWTMAHYFAPVMSALLAVHLLFFSWLWTLRWRGWQAGRATVMMILLLLAVLFPIRWSKRLSIDLDQNIWPVARTRMHEGLTQQSGQHLVFVRYGKNHFPGEEWVYNGPDILASKVIWARSMGEQKDAALRHSLPQSRSWLVEPDQRPVQLQVYEPQAGSK